MISLIASRSSGEAASPMSSALRVAAERHRDRRQQHGDDHRRQAVEDLVAGGLVQRDAGEGHDDADDCRRVLEEDGLGRRVAAGADVARVRLAALGGLVARLAICAHERGALGQAGEKPSTA